MPDLPPDSWDAHTQLPLSRDQPASRTAGEIVKYNHHAHNYVICMSISDTSVSDFVATIGALNEMGRKARGTVMLPLEELSVVRLRTLSTQGVRGIRLHIVKIVHEHGDAISSVEKVVKATAKAIHEAELHWPIDCQFSISTWVKIVPTIIKLHEELGTTFVSDHMFCAGPDDTDTEDLQTCVNLVERGIVYVKISGMAKYAPGGHGQLKKVVERLLRCKDGQMVLWGSDWPHVDIQGNTSEVDVSAQLEMIKETCGSIDPGTWEKLTRDNAARLYA